MHSPSRRGTVTILALRVAYGATLALAPAALSKRWLGPIDDPTSVALRGLGVREVLLHSVALASALRGGPVRPFLAASAAGDVADIAATVTARRGLPRGSSAATLLVAGSSAAMSIDVAARGDG